MIINHAKFKVKKNLIFYDIYIVKTLKIPNYSKLIPANGKDQ